MTELRMEKLSPGSGGTEEIGGLYMSAYGNGRAVPFADLLAVSDVFDLMGLYDGDVLAGFFFAVRHGGITVIPYLAVPEPLRRKGYGTEAVRMISAMYGGDRIVLLPDAPGVGDRLQNSRYSVMRYLSTLGFADCLSRYTFLGNDRQILCRNGTATKEEVDRVMRSLRRRLRCI